MILLQSENLFDKAGFRFISTFQLFHCVLTKYSADYVIIGMEAVIQKSYWEMNTSRIIWRVFCSSNHVNKGLSTLFAFLVKVRSHSNL